MDVFATYRQRFTRIVGWDEAGISGGRGEESSRSILATARPSCIMCDAGASIPMGQRGHVPTIFMKGDIHGNAPPQYFRSDVV